MGQIRADSGEIWVKIYIQFVSLLILREVIEMKKLIMIVGICAVLMSMPALAAIPQTTLTTTVPIPEHIKTLETLPSGDYDGTFVGGIGRIYKENEEWVYETHAYLAGVYKRNRIYSNIYNLEEEQIGSIGAYFGHKLIVGYIESMEGKRAPIVGFLFFNEEYFVGRIMSMFGPAPHIFGKYNPN